MIQVQQVQSFECAGEVGMWTYGTGGARPRGRFGGAHRSGLVNLHQWIDKVLVTKSLRCSTYRKAQRKLLQWLNGYNV